MNSHIGTQPARALWRCVEINWLGKREGMLLTHGMHDVSGIPNQGFFAVEERTTQNRVREERLFGAIRNIFGQDGKDA